jgi:hypothetical protein
MKSEVKGTATSKRLGNIGINHKVAKLNLLKPTGYVMEQQV